MSRLTLDIHPNDFPDLYAMTGDGRCLEPAIMDGTKLLFSRTERYKPGDFVALFKKQEFTAPDEHQFIIKKLILAPRAEYWTDPASYVRSNIRPLVLVEMLNPKTLLQFDPSTLMGIHKCLGPVPEGQSTYKITDEEVRQQANERRHRRVLEPA